MIFIENDKIQEKGRGSKKKRVLPTEWKRYGTE